MFDMRERIGGVRQGVKASHEMERGDGVDMRGVILGVYGSE